MPSVGPGLGIGIPSGAPREVPRADRAGDAPPAPCTGLSGRAPSLTAAQAASVRPRVSLPAASREDSRAPASDTAAKAEVDDSAPKMQQLMEQFTQDLQMEVKADLDKRAEALMKKDEDEDDELEPD